MNCVEDSDSTKRIYGAFGEEKLFLSVEVIPKSEGWRRG